MKVRWNANSLRLRITPLELAQILRGEPVQEMLALTGQTCWQVTIQAAIETALSSTGQLAVMSLAPSDRERLARPDMEGVYFQTAEGVRYLVEKDFPCIHPRAVEMLEPTTETFDAPLDFEKRKQES